MNTKKITLKTNLKSGGIGVNHVESALTLKTNLKAGGWSTNHNQSR